MCKSTNRKQSDPRKGRVSLSLSLGREAVADAVADAPPARFNRPPRNRATRDATREGRGEGNSVGQRVLFIRKIIRIIVNGGTRLRAPHRGPLRFNGPARSCRNAGLNSVSDHREITDRVGINVRRA